MRWGDADALGHVNNVQFARFLESGRVAYYHDVLKVNFAPDSKVSLILADLQMAYLQQVHYPADLEIGTRVSRLGEKSLGMQAAIFRSNETEPVLASHSVMVWFDYQSNASMRIPDPIRVVLKEFEKHPL